jgi:NADPH:quinone reductase-like Zn-dependent oxidoreductase
MQQTMQAAAVDAFPAGPESLKPHTLPVPQAGPDEVLIQVESAGVGAWDPFELEGGFAKMMGTKPQFPYVPGSDGAGTVVAVGNNVRGIKDGDRVYGMSLANPKGGFYAQYAAVKARDVSPIPRGLTIERAGAFPVDAITALCGLDDALKLQPGESVLIFGASGGIGHLAVQLAKRMGARVLAVASGKDGVELAKRLGADLVVDGHSADVEAAARTFAPAGIDAALLTAGGEAAEKALRTIRDGGRVAYPNGVEPTPKPLPGVRFQSYDGQPSPELIRKLNALVEKQPFQVHIARTYPLDRAADALRALDQHYLGKLALRPA